MLRLVKAEIYILFKTRAFRVLCVIAVILGLLLVGLSRMASSEDFLKSSLTGMSEEQQDQYIESIQNSNNGDSPIVQPGGGMGFILNSKDIFHPTAKELFHSSFGAGAMEILMAVLIGAMVAGEYSSGTIKNILAYGKKREYYYISKLLACTVGFAVILGIMVTLATVICSFMYGWGEPFTITQAVELVKVFAGAIAVGMGIISILMLLATLVKSNGSTIGIGIVVMAVLPTIISFLYGKYTWFDKIYESTTSYNWALVTSVRAANGDVLKAAAVGLITMLIATAGGITIFKRQDIK